MAEDVYIPDFRALWLTPALIGLAVLLLACSNARPVQYYRDHAAERNVQLRSCVASMSQSENCRNARQAAFEAKGMPAKNGVPIR